MEANKDKGSRKRKDAPINITYEQKSPTNSPLAQKGQNIPNMATNRKNFVAAYGMIKEMRKDRNAPVDTMGSYENPDPTASKEVQDYQLLISLMLSSQTKDEMTTQAMNRLIQHGLTLENIDATSEDDIKELISCVNFRNNKAKYLKNATRIILNNYKGKIPTNERDLKGLPGIGQESAIVYLNKVRDKKSGIGVEMHIHRVSNRLGWVETESPEQTRAELESFVPEEYWFEMHPLLVGFGQQICVPVAPRCNDCWLQSICPTGIMNLEMGIPPAQPLKKVRKNNGTGQKKGNNNGGAKKREKTDEEIAEEQGEQDDFDEEGDEE